MAVMEGSLSKWTNVMKGWQYRWFVLDENAGLLSYYTSKEKMMRGVRRGCVRLKGAVIGIDDEDDSTFTITVDHKTFHFQARDAEEREKWVRALEDTILRHSSRMRWDTQRTPPTIRDLDNKVSEADAYLQIMIEQTKKLEDRIPTIIDPVEQEKCKIIHNHANTMLDNIKHSIVLLQIAKNTAYPVNGVYQGPVPSSTGGSPVGAVVCTGGQVSPGAPDIQPGIELGSDCLNNSRRESSRSLSGGITLVVPETSYSSSEGEDDFFDANDAPFSPGSQLPTPTGHRSFGCDASSSIPNESTVDAVSIPPSVQPSSSIGRQSLSNNRTDTMPTREDGSIDYDALYEDESDDDSMKSFETHGLVISHMISQIKIGMDLTKVVLPTFILERRSLLEMYADYFAHPDLFVKISDIKDPRDRMVQVVRWYLSSYHGGRKSAVAKKPYNPILGEIFQCHWDLPSNMCLENDCTEKLVTDGPIPWCTRNQLTFVSEQVSHHPPISAFYAEHVNKNISFCAHIYTKSKFLGLSVCVYNIGQGIINVLNYNEEYIVTFPNGYGRSILTIPWIELGGSVKISCPKTGYYADIEFLTKPFYSNKKNRVTADVYGPANKNPFLKISGEWNGVMEAKWTDGSSEVFIDVNKLEMVKKNVRRIHQQEENESRNLWKEVTAGLRFNDIDKATNAKCDLEQKQREAAKDRKDTNTKWETKLFQPVGDQWIYVSPLSSRLTIQNNESTHKSVTNESVQR